MFKKWIVPAVMIAAVFFQPARLLAQHSSPNFSIEESFIGPGGLIDAQSSNYGLRASLGDTGVGNSASTNYQVYGGYTTTAEEYLEFVVNGEVIDMGVLSDQTTASGEGTFYVRSYLANGYVVTTVSEPPTNSAGNTLEPMASQGAPAAGTEQFGINLVANTLPEVFGSDPQQIPDNTFSFGYVADDYNDPNQYKYGVGDVVAQADSSSGRTDYTIAYIMNINLFTTEAGLYVMRHFLVATSTF